MSTRSSIIGGEALRSLRLIEWALFAVSIAGVAFAPGFAAIALGIAWIVALVHKRSTDRLIAAMTLTALFAVLFILGSDVAAFT